MRTRAGTSTLREIIDGARQVVRRDATLATVVAVACVIPAVLLFTWLLSLTRGITHHVPIVVDVVALIVAAAVAFVAARLWVRRITERAVAASAETQMKFSEGELQGVLEMQDNAPAGTSSALLRRAERSLADRLGSTQPYDLAGSLGQQNRTRRVRALIVAASLTGLVLLVAFASPERSRASWSPLLRPVATIAASALPALEVRPGDVSVPRGASVHVDVRARQRDAVVLHWRQRGDVLHEQTVPVIANAASSQIKDIDAPIRYWVSAPDGAASDTFTITPTDPLLLSALSIDVIYPNYLQRTSEHFDKDVPPLELPAGTELRISGRSTRPLSAIALAHDLDRIPLRVDGSTFNTTWVPRTSGTYLWDLTSEAGVDVATPPAPLEIKIVGDAPPEVEVTYPGVDTLMPGEMKQLLVADARDDHGVVNATVVSWRSSMSGREAQVEQPLTLEGDADRKLVRGVLDATTRRLLPGDTLSYFVRVTDNSPMRQTTVSRTFTLRVPGMDEMRERAQSQAEDLVKDADAVAKAMRALETRTRDLERKSVNGARNGASGSGGTPGNTEQKQLTSEQAEQAKEVLQRQEALTADMQKLRDRIDSMERAAQQAGLNDPEMQKRLDELKQLYDQLLTPEMKKQMEQLRAALEKLDPEQVQKALEELAKKQDELRAKLDQSLDLMRKAAVEQEMTKLAQEAKELSTQQQALSEQMKSDSTAGDKQKDVQKKTSDLANALAKLQKKLGDQGESDASTKTGEAQQQTKEAQDAQSQASKQAQQGQKDKAGESGQQAADKLDEAAKVLDAARKEMSASWKKDVQETVDNATQDAISLAQMQKQLLDKMNANAQAGNAPDQQQGKSGDQKSPGVQKGQQEGKQQAGNKDNGQQQGGQAGQKGQGQKQGGQQGSNSGASGQPGGGQQQMQQMRSDQQAVKGGLEQLGKNLQEAGERSAMVNREVGAALARANLSAEQTVKALEQANGENMPSQQAQETLDALNRLALELLKNGQQIEQSESGTGVQQALQQLADLAKQQGNLNGRSNSLLPLNLGPKVMSQQLGAIAREQRDIAQKLGGMNKGGARDDLLGRLDDLAKEADELARDLDGGRLTPQTLQRQSELFHKLLDAGRTMERDEVSEERKAEAGGNLPPAVIRALKPGLFDDANRFTAPTAEQLKDLPPAYRRLILEYFQKLNAAAK